MAFLSFKRCENLKFFWDPQVDFWGVEPQVMWNGPAQTPLQRCYNDRWGSGIYIGDFEGRCDAMENWRWIRDGMIFKQLGTGNWRKQVWTSSHCSGVYTCFLQNFSISVVVSFWRLISWRRLNWSQLRLTHFDSSFTCPPILRVTQMQLQSKVTCSNF